MRDFIDLERELRFSFGGIHPAAHSKELSSEQTVIKAPLLERYLIPLQQNIGKPPKMVVNTGDRVLKYQLLAAADGAFSASLHAPTSGTVEKVTTVTGTAGNAVPAIELKADGLDEAAPALPALDPATATAAELLARIAECGLVGMGGAAFPTAMKLSPPPDARIDTLILNGAECEPYLSADHRLMLETPERILKGAAISAKILGVKRILIGIEANKWDAIHTLNPLVAPYGVHIAVLATRYPHGAEKQLIAALTHRDVPSGGLPSAVGCVVQNVGTAAAIADAVFLGRPSIERIVTVSGDLVAKPGNFLLRIGTPVLEAIRLAGGVTAEPDKFIVGGPMMGFAQKDFNGAVAKNTSGLLCLSTRATRYRRPGSCLNCGRCLQTCSMRLAPLKLALASENDRLDLAKELHAMDCLECGACAYACPAHRPLVQHIRRLKTALRKLKK